jgi:hypothetical protein
MSGVGGPRALAADRPRSTNRLKIEKREARKRQRHEHLVRNEELDRAHGGNRRLLRSGARARRDAVAVRRESRLICLVPVTFGSSAARSTPRATADRPKVVSCAWRHRLVASGLPVGPFLFPRGPAPLFSCTEGLDYLPRPSLYAVTFFVQSLAALYSLLPAFSKSPEYSARRGCHWLDRRNNNLARL